MLTTLASMFTSVHHVLLLLFCRCASPSLNLTKARFIEKQKRKVNALRKRRTAFNIFCCRLVCWPQQYLPMNTTEDKDTTAALHCRTNVARLRRETFQNNNFTDGINQTSPSWWCCAFRHSLVPLQVWMVTPRKPEGIVCAHISSIVLGWFSRHADNTHAY